MRFISCLALLSLLISPAAWAQDIVQGRVDEAPSPEELLIFSEDELVTVATKRKVAVGEGDRRRERRLTPWLRY